MEMTAGDRQDDGSEPSEEAEEELDDGFEEALESSIRRHRKILEALADR